MKFKVFLRKEAEEDLKEAFDYYEDCREGLGADFLLCVEEALARLSKNPNLNRKVFKSVRRSLVKRFPYGLFYLVQGSNVSIISVLHARKNPSSWKKRT